MNRPLLESALAAIEIAGRSFHTNADRHFIDSVIRAIDQELHKPPPIECGMLGWNQGKVYMAYNNVALEDGYHVLYAVKSSD